MSSPLRPRSVFPLPFRRPRRDLREEFCDSCFEFLKSNHAVTALFEDDKNAMLRAEWKEKDYLSCEYQTCCNDRLPYPRRCRLREAILKSRIGRGPFPDVFDVLYYRGEFGRSPKITRIHFLARATAGLRPGATTPIIFTICAFPDDKAAAFVGNTPTMEDLWSSEQIQLARNWIDDCIMRHPQPPPNHGSPPSRLINVSGAGDLVYLHEVTPEEKVAYAALSYCWGGPQTTTLSRQTLPTFIQGISISSLPKTIADAIQVTRDLGLDYLWIDSICIQQDSEGDKIEELERMASIYLNALVTLVAANARTVDEGFLVARKDIMKELPWIRLPFGHGEVFALLTLSDSFQAPELDPLRQRGWALQESLMSPRLLKFGSYNLGWECLLYGSTDQRGVALVREKHAMGPMMRQILQRPQEGVKGIGNQHWINREWTGTVEEYSRRRLTVHSDRLPAIAAVAEIYGRVSGYTHYFAGLWGEDFIGQLLWTTNETDASTGVYTAPSWSWASVDVAVEYPHSFFAYIDSCYLEILSCAIDRAVKALHFGEVTGGSLMVSGLLTSGFPLPLGMPKGRYGHTKISFDREESVAKDLGRVRFLHICDLHDRRGIGYGRDKYLSLGLMLEELSSPEDSFKRVGFFILHNRDVNQFGLKDWLGEAKRRRFSIL